MRGTVVRVLSDAPSRSFASPASEPGSNAVAKGYGQLMHLRGQTLFGPLGKLGFYGHHNRGRAWRT